jgi:protein O-GlcNAc transferase
MAKPRTNSLQDTWKRALTAYQKGEFAKAERLGRDLLKAQPDHAGLLQFMAAVCNSQKRHADAVTFAEQAVKLEPGSPEAHYNLGTALLAAERSEAAVSALERSLALAPSNIDAANNLALALLASRGPHEAEPIVRQAVALQPQNPMGHYVLGLVFGALGDFATAIAGLQNALATRHPNPADVYKAMGRLYLEWGAPADSITAFKSALALKPNSPELLFELGEAQHAINHHAEAAETYTQCLRLAPHNAAAAVALAAARMYLADWRGLDGLPRKIAQAGKEQDAKIHPLKLLALCDDPTLQLKAAVETAGRYASPNPLPPAFRDNHGEKIRLAYVSSDLRMHAVATLAAGIFEQHDKSRFETFAISLGSNDESPMRKRLEAAFDHFIDVQGMASDAVSKLIREHEIDIAIDLNGYTFGHRASILAARPAPIQALFLGYAGTMGADWIDYVIADPIVAPPESAEFFTERIVHLPGCYLPNDSKRPELGSVPERGEHGLPATGFVFLCFNNVYKITPAVFDVWMRLLQKVPDSVAWMSGQAEVMQSNLRREASARGVDASRLIFAPRLDSYAEHLRRQQCADLFLDTLLYNGHTTTVDALWAGVPAVTFPGRSMVARASASLLRATGLPELVAGSLEEYEAIALRLATDRVFHQAIRSRLAEARATATIFDTPRFTRNLEVAYEKMWQRHCEGKLPDHIFA